MFAYLTKFSRAAVAFEDQSFVFPLVDEMRRCLSGVEWLDSESIGLNSSDAIVVFHHESDNEQTVAAALRDAIMNKNLFPNGGVWLSPVRLDKDQRWMNDELLEIFEKVRAAVNESGKVQ